MSGNPKFASLFQEENGYGETFEDFLLGVGSKALLPQPSPIEDDMYHIHDPEPWDARNSFIQHVALKIHFFIPSFIVGVIGGIFFWILYIMMYKVCSKIVCSICPPKKAKEEGVVKSPIEANPDQPQNHHM